MVYISPVNYWPIIESALGILGACLPLLLPIAQMYPFKRIYDISSKAFSSFTKLSRSRDTSSTGISAGKGISRDEEKSVNWLQPYNVP